MSTARCFINTFRILRENWKQWLRRLLPIVVVTSAMASITEMAWFFLDIHILLPAEVLLNAGYPPEAIKQIFGDRTLEIIILSIITILFVIVLYLYICASTHQIRSYRKQMEEALDDKQAATTQKIVFEPIRFTPKVWISSFNRAIVSTIRNIHKRIGVILLSIMMISTLFCLLYLPVFVLVFSSQAATISGMILDNIETPYSVWGAMFATTTIANITLNYLMNFCCWLISSKD